MRKRINVCILCLFLCLALSSGYAQQVFKTTSASVIGYLEYVPQGYNNNSDKYPIVIFLHGIGERGVNSTDPATLSTTIQSVAKLGPPSYVKNGTQFPFILISPQLKNNYGKWPASYVMEVINHVKTYLRVDEKRIYLTGLSLGGGGVWMTAQDFPELFAAIAPVCGGYNTPSLACNIANENLPVWAFHGDADTTVPLSRSVNMVNAINACTPKPNPLAKMTIYPGVGHSAWNNAYKNDNTIHNPNVYQWMMSYTNTLNKGNKIPVANAGADLNITVPSIIINGSGTDSDGSIASYTWTQISGPSTATLVNKLTKALTASTLLTGTYVFRLTVKDNSGNTDSDYVKVTVGTSTNTLPVASAGSDKTITLPTNSVSISGSGTDGDGTIASYAWSKVSGPAATLAGASTQTLQSSAMVEGAYVFRLTVTDDKGGKDTDDVTVTVKAATTSGLTANAGADKTIALPTNATYINGSGTAASGRVIRYYKWSKVSGPAASLNYVSKPALYVYNMNAGTYTFKLTVTDDLGATASDNVQVVVGTGSTATNDATPPPADTGTLTANAGADKTITLPTSSLNITGSGTAASGNVIWYYKWTKVSGPGCNLNYVSKPTLYVYNMNAGTYVFKLVVTDNEGATASDQVTVTVKDGVASAASFTEPEMARIAAAESATTEDQTAVLGNMTRADLENSTVVIYNDSGETLYNGTWNDNTYKDVMNKSGLYIYNVIRDGKRMDAGKIYIRG